VKILILGGIAESKHLATQLIHQQHTVIYSIVGLVRTPELACEIHIGGFSSNGINGSLGLANYCQSHNIELLIDATHPYAVDISANAVTAAKIVDISCWRYSRPGWDESKYPNWHYYDEWDDLAPQIERYQKPFFTIGASVLHYSDRRPQNQQWVMRCVKQQAEIDGITQIHAIGPFYYADELTLMQKHRVDALISKDSGCSRVAEKLDAALTLNIPVYVQRRPKLAQAEQSFSQIDDLVQSIKVITVENPHKKSRA
jgi:precorrin-6A/cobalt-precorrin-6A reductase